MKVLEFGQGGPEVVQVLCEIVWTSDAPTKYITCALALWRLQKVHKLEMITTISSYRFPALVKVLEFE